MFHSSHKLLKSVEKNSLTLSLKNFAQIWAKFKDILKSNHRYIKLTMRSLSDIILPG